MSTDRRTLWAWVATAVLLGLCLAPRPWVPRESSEKKTYHFDKVLHFGMFAAFGFAWARAGRLSRTRAAAVLGVGLALAVGTELAQGLPQVGRDPDTLDALADAVGAAAGIGLAAGFAAPTSDPRDRSPGDRG